MTQAVINIVANVGPVEASMDRLSRKARQDLQALRSLANAPINVSIPAASAGIPNLPAGATSASVSQALGSTNPATVRETARLEAQRIGQERAILEKLKTQAGLVDDQNIIAKRQAALNTEANTVRQSLKAIGDDPTVFTKSVDSFRREQLSQLSRERVAAASSAYSATENAKVTDAARQRIRSSLTEIHTASGREAAAAIKAAKAAEREAAIRAEGAKFGARAGALTYAEKMGLNVSSQRGILGTTRSEVTSGLSSEEKTAFRQEAADAARREGNSLRDLNSVIESTTRARKESVDSTNKVSGVEKQLAAQISRSVTSAQTNLATASAAGPRTPLDVLKIAGASQRLAEIEKLNAAGAGTPELANESRALAKGTRDLSNRLNTAEKAHAEEASSTKSLTAEQKALRSQLLRNITNAQTNVTSAVAAGARTPLDVLKIAGSSQRLSELRSGAESGSGLTGEALNEAKSLAKSTRELSKRLTTAEAVHAEEAAAAVTLTGAERELAQRTRSALSRGNANVQQVLSNQGISPDQRSQAVALKAQLDSFAAANEGVVPTGATTEEARRLARESLELRRRINANLASEAAATSPSDVLLGRTIDRRSARGIAEAEQILSTRGINGQDNFTAAAIKDRLTKLQAESAKTGPTAALANEAETLAAQAVGLRKTINAGLAKQGAAANATAQTDAISQQQSAQQAARDRLDRGRQSQLERQAFNRLLLDQGIPDANGNMKPLGWYQRQQLRIGTGSASSRIDGVPPTARQALAGSFMTTARFAASGAILYGGMRSISEAVKESRNLEKQLNLIEAQFESIGQIDAFGAFRDDLFNIARDTGLATADLAEIGFQLQGAFGDQGTNVVRDNIRAGAELSQLTGLNNKEIVDSLTAASLAFDVSFRRIGDVTLGLQDRFGVLANETITFLGDIAPAAQDAGFSLEEFATIAAVIQQKSGRGGAALAEGLGRVLPAIKERQGDLLGLTARETSLDTPEFIKAVASGDVKNQLIGLSQNFSKLSKESQGYLINLLGGRREAQLIIPLFNQQLNLMEEINETDTTGDVLNNRFTKFQQTLDFELDTLRQKYRQLVIDLYEAGLGTLLKELGQLGSVVVSAFASVLSVFESFNDALGGIPGKILLIAGALKILSATKLGGGLANLTSGGIVNRLSQIAPIAAYSQVRQGGFAPGGQINYPAIGGGNLQIGRVVPPGTQGAALLAGGKALGSSALAAFGGPLGLGLTAALVGSTIRTSVGERIAKQREDFVKELAAQEKDQILKTVESIKKSNPDSLSQQIIKGLTGQKSSYAAALDALQLREGKEIDFNLGAFQSEGKESLTPLLEVALGYKSESQQAMIDALYQKIDSENSLLQKDIIQQLANSSGVASKLEAASSSQAPDDLDAEGLQARIDKIISDYRADSTNDGNIKRFQALKEFLLTFAPALYKQYFAAARSQYEEVNNIIDEINNNNEAGLGSEDLSAQYSAGQVSLRTYLTSIDGEIAQYKKAIEADASYTEARKGYFEAINARSEILEPALASINEFQLDVSTLGGGGNTAEQLLRAIATLRNPDITSPEGKRDRIQKVMELISKTLEERADGVESIIEQNKILLEGIDLEETVPGITKEIVGYQLDNNSLQFDTIIEAIKVAQGGIEATVEQRAALVSVWADALITGETGQAFGEVLNLLEQQLEEAYQELNDARRGGGTPDPALLARIREIVGLIDEVNSLDANLGVQLPGKKAKGQPRTDKSEENSLSDLADAKLEYQKALAGGNQLLVAQLELQGANQAVANTLPDTVERYQALARQATAQFGIINQVAAIEQARLGYLRALTDDPIAQAGFDLQIANVALSAAQQNNDPVGVYAALGQIKAANDAAEQAQFDLINARAELFAAQVSENPLAAAQAGIDAANRAYDQAKTEAQRIRATIQKIEAQRQLRDVILDISASQTELVQALLTYAGDNRGAAEEGIAQAERNLQVAIASGDQAAINRAQVALIAMRQTMDDVITAERQSAEELVQAQRQGDARGQAEAALRAAERAYAEAKGPEEKNRTLAALLNARRTFEETIIDEAVAGQELAGATFSANGNALGAAYAGMAAAAIRLEALTRQGAGKAEILRARAAYVQAAGAVRNAIQDTISAQFELIEAVASAAGRTVEAAEAALANAQAKLAAAENGGGQAEILRARADVVRQESAVRDARLSEGQSDIDFALQMEQITTQQAISQLEALLQVPKITKQQTQQLLLKIKSLRDELGGDLQFNIPSFLGLPTLYTARRLNDSNGGFQDNRQYQIIVNPSPGMDEEALANLVLDRAGAQISTPVYSPTYDRMY